MKKSSSLNIILLILIVLYLALFYVSCSDMKMDGAMFCCVLISFAQILILLPKKRALSIFGLVLNCFNVVSFIILKLRDCLNGHIWGGIIDGLTDRLTDELSVLDYITIFVGAIICALYIEKIGDETK